MPGDVVERRGLWKVRVVGVNNAAPKNAKGGTSRQDAIERTLYKVNFLLFSFSFFLLFFPSLFFLFCYLFFFVLFPRCTLTNHI